MIINNIYVIKLIINIIVKLITNNNMNKNMLIAKYKLKLILFQHLFHYCYLLTQHKIGANSTGQIFR